MLKGLLDGTHLFMALFKARSQAVYGIDE